MTTFVSTLPVLDVDLHLVEVARALPADGRAAELLVGRLPVEGPRAVTLARGLEPARVVVERRPRGPREHRDGLRRRRPQRERRPLAVGVPRDAELALGGVLGEQVVDDARHLDPGRGRERAAVGPGDEQLARERRLDLRAVERLAVVEHPQRGVPGERRELGRDVVGQARRVDLERVRRRALRGLDLAVGASRVTESPPSGRPTGSTRRPCRGPRPGDDALAHPVRGLLAGAGERRVRDVDRQDVGREVVGEGDQLAVTDGELVVRPVARAADAVVLRPAQAVRDLALVRARPRGGRSTRCRRRRRPGP